MGLFGRGRSSRVTPTQTPPGGSLEDRVRQIGREILDEARSQRGGFLSRKFWSDQLMNWSMKDEQFKVQLFRFIDVFPMLRTPQDVHEHLLDYLSRPGVKLPPGMGVGLAAGGLLKGTMTGVITGQIEKMAGKFIAGVDAASAIPELRKLWEGGIAFSLDLLGEACVSDAEADVYQKRYLDLIETLPAEVAQWKANPVLEADHIGPVPRANVSIKISSLCARINPADFEGSLAALVEAIRPILDAARKHGVLVNFDMEQSAMKDLTLALFERCCEQFDFPAGLAMQAYLRSGDDDARRIIDWARRSGRQITVRLIKGAYWDYETIHAEQKGWPVPVWTRKQDTDACFERMAQLFVEQMPRKAGDPGVKLALGSHNVRSMAYVLGLCEQSGLPPAVVEFQMLRGMADELKTAITTRGLRLREYVPVGQMIPGMAYLVRRLLENTSNESWLRAGLIDDAGVELLLASPHAAEHGEGPDRAKLAERHALTAAIDGLGDGQAFLNEPMRDFSQAEVRSVFAAAIGRAAVPKVANDATVEHAREAVTRAAGAFPTWRGTDPKARAQMIVKAASIMRSRRDELSGIMIKEAGKPWAEADADVCEAIDFCEFYARAAVDLFSPQRLGKFAGEFNEQWHEPCGVAVVISPWNFPLAIGCGMTTAALATGNTAIVKPSKQTPGIAKVMCEILWQAGIPRDVLHFVAGPGREVGAALVRDPRVAIVAFTGSKAVGLDLYQAAGITADEQPHLKRVICEMGGKNAVIVDASADLDEAVLAVRQSAFGYAGQKCSACSRVVVLDAVHDVFLRRLVEATRALRVDNPILPGTDVGPVIDAGAGQKIREYIEIGRGEGKLELACDVAQGVAERLGKPLIGPHIFSGIRPEHRLAQEEIFGPVLSVMRVKDFDEALRVGNGCVYKLTGGVFSRTPAHLERAVREFRVGNLYINRGITGALVGRQPFGGFALSGGGTKAGGAEYLLHFVVPRCCSENTMRRGFAPAV
ncbi:MAG: proline dehydrogenase family protein [Tepidisphaerales bacterium]